MPIFNKDTGVSPAPQFRQAPPIKAPDFGGLIRDLGETAGNIVQETDNNNQQYIKDSLRDAYNVDNKIFGVDAAATLNAPIDTARRTPEGTPEAMKQATDQLTNMKAAYAQGRIRESNYQGRMSAVMRELRARFPGYDDQIDQIATRMVGENPDHALRKALERETKEDKSKIDSLAKEQWHEQIAWQKEGALSPGWEKRSYIDNLREANENLWQKAQTTRQASQLSLDAQENKNVEDKAKMFLSQAAQTNANVELNSALRSAGMSTYADVVDKLKQFAADGTIDGKEREQVNFIMQNLRQGVSNRQRSLENMTLPGDPQKRTVGGLITDQKFLKDQEEKAHAYINDVEKNILDGNFGILGLAKARIESQKDSDQLELMKSPVIRESMARHIVMGPDGFALYLNANPQFMKDLINDRSREHFAAYVTGVAQGAPEVRSITDATKLVGRDVNLDPKLKGAAIKYLTDAMVNPASNPQDIKKFANHLFSGNNNNFAEQMLKGDKPEMSPESLKQSLRIMTSPGMTAVIKKINDPKLLEDYTKFTLNNTQFLYHNDSTDVMAAHTTEGGKLRLVEDKGTLKMVFDQSQSAGNANPTSAAFEQKQYSAIQAKMQEKLDRLNLGLQSMGDLYEAQGKNRAMAVKDFMETVQLDPSKEKEVSFPTAVGMALQKWWTSGGEEKAQKPTPNQELMDRSNKALEGSKKMKPLLPPVPNEKRSNYAPDGTPVSNANAAIDSNFGEASFVREVQGSEAGVRTQPISENLRTVLDKSAAEAGVHVEVFSGGQPAKGEGWPRTGSTRHDNGDAGDVRLSIVENGKKRLLHMDDPQDRPYFEAFARSAAANGATGLGAGIDYMGPNAMHIGFGNKMVWGARGSSERAPEWLRTAVNDGWGKGKVATK